MNTKALRQKILDLAIHGKLVQQDPNDEPASVLLERIRDEKERLIKEGKIKRHKKTKTTSDKPHYPYELPEGWVWTTLGEISNYGTTINIQVDDIDKNEWILELEDIEKETANIIQRLSASERSVKGTRHKFSAGSILYSKLRTYLNKVLVAPSEGYCTTEIMPFDTYGIISNEYICHVLRSPFFLGYTLQCGYGVKMPRLSTTDACNGMIPLPPLNEQIRIVEAIKYLLVLIDIIESGKENLQETIRQAKSKILDLAIHGKLVPQDPTDEPATELLKRINPKAEITCDNSQYGKLPKGWCLTTFKGTFKDISSKPFQILQSQIKIKGKHPVISQSSNFIEGYSDEDVLYKCDTPIIIFGDHTRNVKYVDFDFIVGADGVKIIKPYLDAKYGYYLIFYAASHIVNKGYSRHFSQISKFDYIVPPLQEQHRIVAKIEELFAQLDKIEASL